MLVLLQTRGRLYSILQGLPWHLISNPLFWREEEKEKRDTMKAMMERSLQNNHQG